MHTVKLGAFRRLMRGAFDCVPRPGFLPVSRARALRSMVARHLLDSLAVIPYLYGKRLLDIGSGAGIRAWCWLSRIPIVEWVLLDRSLKKMRCLRQVLLVTHRRLSNRPMKSAIAELREAQEDLQSIAGRIAAERVAGPLAALKRTATEIGEAWSGSFLGYHALVYYKGLKPPPPGAHFSSEWGLRDAFNIGDE